jgi:pimeloyl-ACP methyl ester carboxylesterase
MRFLVVIALLALPSCVLPGAHADDAPVARDDGTSWIEIDGAWLRVLDVGPKNGGKAPIVFVHGYGSRLEAWRELVPELARDRRVITFDQRGFGLSEKPKGAYGPTTHTNDLLAIVDALDVDRPVLIGHSYGGGVVLRAALARPDAFRGLALVSTFAFEESVPPSFKMAKLPLVGELLFGAFYEEVPGEKYLLAFHDTDRFVTVEALDEMKALMAQPGAVYAAMETVRGMDYAAHEGGYRSIAVPTVVVWGEKDRVVPLKMGKHLSYVLDRELVVLEGTGHMPMWERPSSVLRALAPLLAAADTADEIIKSDSVVDDDTPDGDDVPAAHTDSDRSITDEPGATDATSTDAAQEANAEADAGLVSE